MSTENTKPLRVLFCVGVTQTFFDLPGDQIGMVWEATGEMLKGIAGLEGVKVLGTMDDDQIMVGTSAAFPWTCYILADVPDIATVTAACNLFRVTPVGAHRLWRYMRVEARVGRELVIPE
ncbi:hypothetical protein [Komagataeibacter xylinus]|uniref:IacB protein n=1 Tax=Komagataeibacter xylinus TaxID=28448 RepID=A0A857FNX8_KOMXY|nr:hypothetical protein [Komagataeibacter xylinus]QHC35993.1 hypothetical protein FMA36_11280 [Komagataeibacter xylinus]